jgi:hypothetical protein
MREQRVSRLTSIGSARRCATHAHQNRVADAAIWKIAIQRRVQKENLFASLNFAVWLYEKTMQHI